MNNRVDWFVVAWTTVALLALLVFYICFQDKLEHDLLMKSIEMNCFVGPLEAPGLPETPGTGL